MLIRLAPLLVLVMLTAPRVGAFTLLDHPDLANIEAEQIRRWADYQSGQPFVLTYAIDANFMAGEDATTVANAVFAIEAALESWSDATNGMVTFELSPFAASRNVGNAPPSVFVGPSLDEWLICAAACNYNSQCMAENCPSPGWGAHIDFFSEPTGYMVSTGEIDYEMMSCNLGFTAVHRLGGTSIASADIYLNSDWDWSTDAGLANPAKSQPSDDSGLAPMAVPDQRIIMCSCDLHKMETYPSRAAGHGGTIDRADCTPLHSQWVVDIQTVIVHEVGHALGLDHPDQAAGNGGENLNPWTYAIGEPVEPTAVMDGAYTGVKRDLIDDDIGGLSYLYPPEFYGDIDASGSIGLVDVFMALDAFEGIAYADPWLVNRLDFNTRNGRVDLDELQQLLLWIVDPINNPPGVVPSQGGGFLTGAPSGPTSITVTGSTDPWDIGVGGKVQLTLSIDNPDQRIVQGWDIRVQFFSDILLNPTYETGRDFLTGQSLTPIQITPIAPGQSEMRIGSFGFDIDDSTTGTLVVVSFDIDLVAAAAESTIIFPYIETSIIVAMPYSHQFAMDANFPDETLTGVPAMGEAYLLDADGNGAFNLDDLYAQSMAPVDVNYDTIIDALDDEAIRWTLRSDEQEDILDGSGGGEDPPMSLQAPDIGPARYEIPGELLARLLRK